MNHEYDQITAFHYSAFRPSLHAAILKESLAPDKSFSYGLDVGCGTGQSSIALTSFCDEVIGIEPSVAMLQKSIKHPNITYRLYNKKHFIFSDDYFDLITFAGSLYYAKSQRLLDEVVRVTKNTSKIVVYDFELLMGDILEKLDLEIDRQEKSHYDHEVNFDGLSHKSIKVEKKFKNHFSLEVTIANLSHLLLSSKDNYTLLRKSFSKENLHNKVSQKLQAVCNAENIFLDAITYSTVYQNVK